MGFIQLRPPAGRAARLPGRRSVLCLMCFALVVWLAGGAKILGRAAAQEPPTLSVDGSGGLATPSGEATYYIRLLNGSDRMLPGGVITHTLPAGFSYLPGSTQATTGGWPISQAEPAIQGWTLSWGPFRLPAAGHSAHNPTGVHTFVQDLCLTEFVDFQLDQALELAGSGGYVTQLFYRITSETAGPDPCVVYFVNGAYDRNLVPILRLQGNWNRVGFWEKPAAGPQGDYAAIAAAFARYVEGLPRRDTHPLYVTIWNEPDLWVEWSGQPNAQEYGRFFVAVSQAIRRLGDPRIRILNGAVTPANTKFIRQLLGVPGFVNAFDAWASHCYPYNHPPSYNIHRRTARYGNTVIDCYIEERDAIARYGGRSGFKFVVKETGHGLGDDLYNFEGYPRINESNRASYIASAFRDYWRAWPEVIAATPFELGDPWGGWDWLDWVNYTLSLDPFHFSQVPHAQYQAVAALPKPRGAAVPHGIEITFRARLAADVPPGTYTSQLAGAATGATATPRWSAAVRVVEHIDKLYLPTLGGRQSGGVWTLDAPPDGIASSLAPAERVDGSPPEGDGAITPTHFLSEGVNPAGEGRPPGRQARRLFSARGGALLLDSPGGRAYAGLTGGELAVLNIRGLAVERRIGLGAEPVAMTSGARAGLVYAALETGEIVLVDAGSGQVAARVGGLERPRSLAFDRATGSLLVADAGTGEIVRWRGDLSARRATRALDDLPGQVLLDTAQRRLYVTLPGARRVVALGADSLEPIAQAELAGGPLIEMALDATGGRLYVLSALSPEYRGIAVLDAGDLSPLALLAGSPAFPLQRASAMALSSEGRLWVGEREVLYLVAPEDFGVVTRVALEEPVARGGLAADGAGRLVGMGAEGVFVYEEAGER